jgi:hypothetical protein
MRLGRILAQLRASEIVTLEQSKVNADRQIHRHATQLAIASARIATDQSHTVAAFEGCSRETACRTCLRSRRSYSYSQVSNQIPPAAPLAFTYKRS